MASRDPLGNTAPENPFEAGQTALEEGRFVDAANHLRAALRLGTHSAEEEAVLRCLLSEALEKRSLNREQLEVVAKYEKFSEFVRLSERTQMHVLVRLGWGYSFNDDIPRAIALFNQSMQIARKLEDHAGLGACYTGLGRAYRNFSEIRIARDHYISALEHYRQTGNWRQLAESHMSVGYIGAFDGDYRSAMQSLNQALAIIGYRNEPGLLGRVYMYLAITHDNLGATDKALACWEKSIENFRQAGNSVSLAINQNNLAVKLIWLGQWERSEQLPKEAMDVLKDSSHIAEYGGAVDTLAQLHLLQGRFEEADRLLEESLRIVASVKSGEWVELNTQITIGRSLIIRGQPDLAIKPLERAIEICQSKGDYRLIVDARLELAEALLQKGEVERADEIVTDVRSFLRESPNMLGWGLMMRLVAEVQNAKGHTAAAIQSLGQSTSMFEVRGNQYACALNRIIHSQMLERLGRVDEAISEVESALRVFDHLGASFNTRQARVRLEALKSLPAANILQPEFALSTTSVTPDLASAMDGFIAQRLVQASVMRELLLHELASILRSQSSSRAVLVLEVIQGEETSEQKNRLRLAASVGLSEKEISDNIDFLTDMPSNQYSRHFVFPFADNQQSSYLVRLIEPKSDRFLDWNVSLEPLLNLVELGLETHTLRSRTRRTQAFNPARLLAQVELPGFICASRAMSRVLEQIHKIRSSNVTVLITGESGTGKELIARAVHAGSSRRSNVFIPFNCSAAPREMIESQLFGYRKGAFTGAVESNRGILRAADGGTLFLDEMGDLPLDLQPKLLRFLQEGEVHPIGETQPVKIAVRVITATNADLERAVLEGRFREDLFHRLNVIRINVPPLRERREEIPALISYYMNLYQQEAAKRDIQLSEEAMDMMVVYDWPGNVRQLCNEVRRVVAYNESGALVTQDSLSPEIVQAGRDLHTPPSKPKQMAETHIVAPTGGTIAEAVEELERRMIRDALQRSSGNIARAAKELGLSRKGLYLKMDRLNFKV